MKRLIFVLAAMVVLATVARLGIEVVRHFNQDKADACWENTLGVELDSLIASFPSRGANESAVLAEQAGAAFGLNLVPKAEKARFIEIGPSGDRITELDPIIRTWEMELVELSTEATIAPPEEVLEVIRERRSELDRLIGELRDGDLPIWELDFAEGKGDIANLIGQMQLNRWLAAAAASDVLMGEHQHAQEVLDAAWRLHEDNHVRPDILSRLVGMASNKAVLVLLRFVREPWLVWDERLKAADQYQAFPSSLYLDQVSLQKSILIGDAFGNPTGFRRRAWLAFSKPIMGLALTSASRATCEGFQRLPTENVRAFDPDGYHSRILNEFSEWNRVSRPAVGNHWAVWIRALRVALASDLTVDVMQLNRMQPESFVQVLESLPKTVTSSRWNGAQWRWSQSETGVRITLVGDVPDPEVPDRVSIISVDHEVRPDR